MGCSLKELREVECPQSCQLPPIQGAIKSSTYKSSSTLKFNKVNKVETKKPKQINPVKLESIAALPEPVSEPEKTDKPPLQPEVPIPPEPYVAVRIMGEYYIGTLDSGSGKSYLSEEIATKLRAAGYKLYPTYQKVDFLVGGVRATGVLSVNIYHPLGSLPFNFYVIPGAQELILGADFSSVTNIMPDRTRGGWYNAKHPDKIYPFAKYERMRSNRIRHKKTFGEELCSDMDGPDDVCYKITTLVDEYHDKNLFSTTPGIAKDVQHEIPLLPGTKPHRHKSRPMNEERRDILDDCLDNLIWDDIIEEGISEWAHCPVIVEKKVKKGQPKHFRLCVDYRPINSRTALTPHTMPRIDYILAQLGKAVVFSTIDLSQGYHQIVMKKEHRDRTAFVTPHRGTFLYKRMPFGLAGSGYTFQRAMDRCLQGGAAYHHAMAFLDDCVVYSSSWAEHEKHLRDVFERLHKAGFTINPDKVTIGRTKITLLGHIIEPGICRPDPEKVRAVNEYAVPKTPKHIQRFLGFIGFYRAYIKDFSKIASPLTWLLRDNVPWHWGERQQRAFKELCAALTADTCLALPDMGKPFTIQCDASLEGLGAVLVQEHSLGPRPVAFASRQLLPAEKNYCITELETLGVIWATQKFIQYIEYSHFTVETDHRSLRTMMTLEEPSGRARRWFMRLMGLDCTISYRRGVCNIPADALSRAPCTSEEPPRPIRLVDELLPIADPPTEFRLQFAPVDPELEAATPLHQCKKCTETPKDPETGLRMPRGPRVPKDNVSSDTVRRIICEPANMPASNAEWSTAQQGDEEVSNLIELVLDEDTNVLSRGYFISNQGVLKRHMLNRDVIVVPASHRAAVIRTNHDYITGGHLGMFKTTRRIAQSFTWRRMKSDVQDYIRGCDTCQKTKSPNRGPYGLMDSKLARGPGQSVSCDLIGPLPRSASGHEHALVIVDDFTKNLEVYPLVRATANTVAARMVDYCFRYGFMNHLRSDNGPQFASALWGEVCDILGIKARKIVTYRPQGNPTERTNKTLKTCIKAYTEKHRSWDKYLPALVFAIRTSVNETTGFTPAMLTYGRELRDPFTVDPDMPAIDASPSAAAEFAERLKDKLDAVIDDTRTHMAAARERRMKYYNEGRLPSPFQVGDLVLRKTHTLSDAAKGITSSLAWPQDGPAKLVNAISDNVFELEDMQGNPLGRANVDQLDPYDFQPDWAREEDPETSTLEDTVAEEDSDDRETTAVDEAVVVTVPELVEQEPDTLVQPAADSDDSEESENEFLDTFDVPLMQPVSAASFSERPPPDPPPLRRPVRFRQLPARFRDFVTIVIGLLLFTVTIPIAQ